MRIPCPNPCWHALGLLVALLVGCAAPPPPPSPPPAQPVAAQGSTVILVSLDGFHPDYLGWGLTPVLDRLASEGVRAHWMLPSYPSLTFPNHYTLVTGLRPDRHGIVNNDMRDPELGTFSLGNREAVGDGRWWGGEPLWVTLERRGVPSATMFWPGSEAAIDGVRPSHWRPFSKDFAAEARVQAVLDWLDLPPAGRPRLVTLYFEHVDSAGHDVGIGSPAHREAIALVDAMLGRLLQGLRVRGLEEETHLVVTSDHGMAAVLPARIVVLDEVVPLSAVDIIDAGQILQLDARPGYEDLVERALLRPHAGMQCWRKGDIPDAWHYGSHPRIPSFHCQADVGGSIQTRAWLEDRKGKLKPGAHGYDPYDASMRALFIARGPRLQRGGVIEPFDNVHVYSLLAALLGIGEAVPADVDADPAVLAPILQPQAAAR